MNPPYARPLITQFCEAVSAKFESGEIKQACVLVNNATETAWFQMMLKICSAVCFPQSRIKFLDPSGTPTGAPLQGQAVIYFGNRLSYFRDAFKVFGPIFSRE
jgi:ParB family chromosome partitioning protein